MKRRLPFHRRGSNGNAAYCACFLCHCVCCLRNYEVTGNLQKICDPQEAWVEFEIYTMCKHMV